MYVSRACIKYVRTDTDPVADHAVAAVAESQRVFVVVVVVVVCTEYSV